MILGIQNTYPSQTSVQKLAGKLAQRQPLEKEMVFSIQKSLVGNMQRFGRKVARFSRHPFFFVFPLVNFFSFPIDLYQGCEEFEWNVY